jgi:hypothetical protein
MLNFVENLLENETDPRSGPMNDQDHSLSLADPDRSLVLSHFLTNFLQNLASCHTAFRGIVDRFVATGSIEKGKSVGRPPVNDEIVEDLRQRMEQNSKKVPQEVITSD